MSTATVKLPPEKEEAAPPEPASEQTVVTLSNRPAFREPRFGGGQAGALVLAVLMTALLGLVLPITQWLSELNKPDSTLRGVDVVMPTPPPPPPDPPPPEQETQEQEKPKMEKPPMRMSLSQLDVALNPGMGNALAAGFDMGAFAVESDAIEDIQTFSIAELDRPPRRISGPAPRTPPAFKNMRVQGEVKLVVLIDENGNVRVLDVRSSTHRDFEQPAILATEASKYEPPTKDGEPARVKFILPVRF